MSEEENETYLEVEDIISMFPIRLKRRVKNLKSKLSVKEKDAIEDIMVDLSNGELGSIERDPLFESIEERKSLVSHTSDLEHEIKNLYLGDAVLLLEHRERLRERHRESNSNRRRRPRSRAQSRRSRPTTGGGRKSRKTRKTRRHTRKKKN